MIERRMRGGAGQGVFRNAAIDSGEQPLWVKSGNPQNEDIFSAVPHKADIVEQRPNARTVSAGPVPVVSDFSPSRNS
jgi:hypothetical protein